MQMRKRLIKKIKLTLNKESEPKHEDKKQSVSPELKTRRICHTDDPNEE